MLKAVCLDEKEHGFLINFIENYKDENNRANVSSAIRFLMIKGFEALYGTKSVNIPPYNKSKVNLDEIKKEVLNDVAQQLNDKISQEVNNKLNLQLIENNSQLMNTLMTVLTKSNTTDNLATLISTLNKNDNQQTQLLIQQLIQAVNKQQPVIVPSSIPPLVSYPSQPFINSPQFANPSQQSFYSQSFSPTPSPSSSMNMNVSSSSSSPSLSTPPPSAGSTMKQVEETQTNEKDETMINRNEMSTKAKTKVKEIAKSDGDKNINGLLANLISNASR